MPSSAVKKTSSCVRPGVREVLARLLRLVSALMRLDLPTLERPTKAISSPFMVGSEAAEPAADTNCHLDANSLRPAPISLVVKVSADIVLTLPVSDLAPYARITFFFEQAFDAAPDISEIVPQFNLGAMAPHDDRLLDDRQRIVPGPVNHEPGRERCQHEGEDHRHPIEHDLLSGVGRRRIELHLEPHGDAHDERQAPSTRKDPTTGRCDGS